MTELEMTELEGNGNSNAPTTTKTSLMVMTKEGVMEKVIVEEEACCSSAKEADDAPVEVFVNQGLRRWEASRATWLRDCKLNRDASTPKAAVPLDVDEIIDLIFSQRWRAQSEKSNFPQPVPLPQMVDILVDLWEAEGLDI
mmetsp:Transcript_29299/g.48428  ORF Transcript_29299/g.48428 Transcript_29299/m.48428 type:complete len:141 (+) Transcript_29299:22-444(+)